jgi:hypothetical protein
MDFYHCITTQIVNFNSDNPDKQLVTKEVVTTKKRFFWGLFKTTDIKDITQNFAEDKKKGLGF